MRKDGFLLWILFTAAAAFCLGLVIGKLAADAPSELRDEKRRLDAQLATTQFELQRVRESAQNGMSDLKAARASLADGWDKLRQLEALARAKDAPSAAVPAEPAEPWPWRSVASWHVHGTRTTELFTIRGPRWKISWGADGYTSIFAYRENGEMAAIANGETSGTSMVHAGPGRYYLEITALEPALVAVEDHIPNPSGPPS